MPSRNPETDKELIEAGALLYQRGMVPATSGNFSARQDDEVTITVSGAHKGRLTPDQLMSIDLQGNALDGGKPSAETLLHTQLYNHYPAIRSVLHVHSPVSTVISRRHAQSGQSEIVLENYELLKAFPAITTHATRIIVPVFANDQDIARLSAKVSAYMQSNNDIHGYLIAGHGLYTWGDSVSQALNHVEAFEFLFECELLQKGDGS